MEIRTRAKRWGSSFGIILPKTFVDARGIRENDEIIIEIKSNPIAANFFGRLKKKINKTAQELKDDARRGWD